MNIFKKEKDIYGRYSSERTHNSAEEFFTAVKRIKTKLGDRSYKLDRYIGMLLEAIHCTLNQDAAEEGFSVYSELRGICLSILKGGSKYNEHGFYSTAKDFMENHRLPYKEWYTLLEIYCVLLTPKFTDYAAKIYKNQLKDKIRSVFDIVALMCDYKDLANIVGETEMDKLNEAIKARFLIYPLMESFLQSITDQYLYCLLHRDVETSKQVFRLLTEVKE